MQVICCYTKLLPKTAEALAKYAPDAEYIDTSGSIYDYNEAIREHWTGREDLVVVEGDKVITADVIPSFNVCRCNRLWCSYSYTVYPRPWAQEVSFGLGCARFSCAVQQLIPVESFVTDDSTAEELGLASRCPLCNGAGCWRYLDSRIAAQMYKHEISVHVHGRVEHLHTYEDQAYWNRVIELGSSLAGPAWSYSL